VVTEGWRQLHNEEVFNFYSSPNSTRKEDGIKEDEMGRDSSTHGREEKLIQNFSRET
jgi:hypothetical protein